MEKSFERFDNLLFGVTYGTPLDKKNLEPFTSTYVWGLIKEHRAVLEWAIKVHKDRFGKDQVNGTTICDFMLRDYKNIDQALYTELARNVLSNIDLAHRGPSGVSYLCLVLANKEFPLSEEEKAFVVDEAMKQYGTTRWEKTKQEFEKKLEEGGFNDNQTVYAEFGGQSQPVGAKTFLEYLHEVYGASFSLRHGYEPYDIRYRILRNKNWSDEEKDTFIKEFWADAEDYDKILEKLEWGIVNDDVNFEIDDVGTLAIEIDDLYDISKEKLISLFASKNKSQEEAEELFEEIELCRHMHKVRPMQWERADENEIKIQI